MRFGYGGCDTGNFLDGTPVFGLVPRPRLGRLNLEAGFAYLRSQGLGDLFSYVAEDFDDPLPENFLLKPPP